MKPVNRQEPDRTSDRRSRPDQGRAVDSPEPRGDSPRVPVDKIGRFVIQQAMTGEAGWSTFLGLDPVFEQKVLIHVAGESVFPTAAARLQFVETAQAAKELSHPSIVPVVGSGKCQLGTYIAYRHRPGIPLTQWLAEQKGPLDGKSAAGLVQCLADAVQHAHQRDVLHRALNPDHILIDRPEAERKSETWTPVQVRINHYGMGPALRENGELESDRADMLIYCSPEERAGEVEIGTGTDIYSLGVILYRLSIGSLPVGSALLLNDTTDPWPMDGPLESVCRRCLRDLPSERYPTAFELADELILCYQDLSTTGRSGRGLKKLLRWPR